MTRKVRQNVGFVVSDLSSQADNLLQIRADMFPSIVGELIIIGTEVYN